jgi:hypothetical protein
VEIEMEKVLLGKIGLEASALIMGSDVLGSKLDRETSFALLDCYFENGGNLIDLVVARAKASSECGCESEVPGTRYW